ncbi:phospholipase D family protein [Geopsychrobacter electrodiphilus]|uniref:phospholipase D family protein n=1 Tax=Geopsychrobacter electrodiphilus TaxID=225196 RepID=UPI00036BFD6E|nr:phospholipase D family protein [Geopsychrobacter electrodiphilus]
MQLQGTEAYRDNLAIKIGGARESLILLSAYVTVPGIQWVVDKLKGKIIKGDLVVRWHPDDLLSGASSLDVYEIVKSLGWNLYIATELHAKVVLVDEKELFLGSANLTGRGLALVPGGNNELGVELNATLRDVAALYAVRDESVLLTDDLFKAIKAHIGNLPKINSSRSPWPPNIQSYFQKIPRRLWVADCFWTSPTDTVIAFSEDEEHSIEHDSRLLGFPKGVERAQKAELSRAFLTSRAWLWVNCLIRESGEDGLFFGTLTQKLHNALLDDPTPYRKNVKGLVANLYAWIRYLDLPNVIIDQPGRRSERIRVTI